MADEHITVKLRQLTPYPLDTVLGEDGIYIWEQATGILRQANVSQLPFSSGGGGGTQTLVGSPFKARVMDAGVTVTEVTPGYFETTIEDIRLINKTDYPVSSTQLNNASFRDSEITYDAVNGTVTIKNFRLITGESVILYPDGIQTPSSGGGSLTDLIRRVSKLELMAAPFVENVLGAGGGRVIWNRPANEIPAGWVEDTDFRGRTIIGLDSNDTDFNTIGKTGGSKDVIMTLPNLIDHDHEYSFYQSPRPGSGTANNAYADTLSLGTRRTGKTGSSTPEPMNILNPYRIVFVIKFVGVE